MFTSKYVVYKGSSGRPVKLVQIALNLRGYHSGNEPLVEDGYCGPQTERGIKLFQQDNGMRPANGKLTYEDIFILWLPLDIELRKPQKALSSDISHSVDPSKAATVFRYLTVRVFKSKLGQVSLFFTVVAVSILGVGHITDRGYGAEVSIPKVIEFILSPPSQAPLEASEELEANGSSRP